MRVCTLYPCHDPRRYPCQSPDKDKDKDRDKDIDKDTDPNALAALVNKIEFMRMGATILSLGRARCEPCSYFALSKLGVMSNLSRFLSISLTNAARALGSGYSQTSV